MQDRTTETRQDTTECITRHDRIIQIHVGKKKKKTLMRGVTKQKKWNLARGKKGEGKKWKGKINI